MVGSGTKNIRDMLKISGILVLFIVLILLTNSASAADTGIGVPGPQYICYAKANLDAYPNPEFITKEVTLDASKSECYCYLKGEPEYRQQRCEYEFDFGDGSPIVSGNTPIAIHPYNILGDHTATVKVTAKPPSDRYGVPVSDTASTVVTTKPAATLSADISVVPNPTTMCTEITNFEATNIVCEFEPGNSCTPDFYKFNYGDGHGNTPSNSKTSTHIYEYANTYNANVKLYLGDVSGGQSAISSPTSVTVNNNPDYLEGICEKQKYITTSLVITPSPRRDNSLITFDASGSTCTYADSSSCTINTYDFEFNDGSGTITTTSPIVTKNGYPPGWGSVKLTTHSGRQQSAKTPYSFLVYGRILTPILDITPALPNTYETVIFDATRSRCVFEDNNIDACPIEKYIFDFGDGTPVIEGTNPTVTHTYTTAKTYTAKLTIKSGYGSKDTTNEVQVGGTSLNAKLKISPSPAQICAGEITFDASESTCTYPDGSACTITDYAFALGDGSVRNGKTPILKYGYTGVAAAKGSADVKLTITSQERKTNSVTKTLVFDKKMSHEWLTLKGNQFRTSSSPSSVPLSPVKSWERPLGLPGNGQTITSLLVDDGKVYTTLNANSGYYTKRLRAYDACTGDPIWKSDRTIWETEIIENPIGSPSISGDKIIYTTEPSSVHAFDKNTGNLLWVHGSQPNEAILTGASVNYGIVVYGLYRFDFATKKSSSLLIALDENTGNLLWEHKITEDVGSPSSLKVAFRTPTIAYGNVYFGYGTSIYALSLNGNGLKTPDAYGWLWHYFSPGNHYVVAGPAAVENGIVYFIKRDFRDQNEHLEALDAFNGKLIWELNGLGRIPYALQAISPAVHENKVFVANSEGHIYAFDAKTGAHVWDHTMPYTISSISSPSVADGVVLIQAKKSDGTGLLYAINEEHGGILWEYAAGNTPKYELAPTIAYNKIYTPTDDIKIYSLEDSANINAIIEPSGKDYKTYPKKDFVSNEDGAITFDASKSFSNEGNIVNYEWKVTGPISSTVTTTSPQWTFNPNKQKGRYEVTLKITDTSGNTDSDTIIAKLYTTKANLRIPDQVQYYDWYTHHYGTSQAEGIDWDVIYNWDLNLDAHYETETYTGRLDHIYPFTNADDKQTYSSNLLVEDEIGRTSTAQAPITYSQHIGKIKNTNGITIDLDKEGDFYDYRTIGPCTNSKGEPDTEVAIKFKGVSMVPFQRMKWDFTNDGIPDVYNDLSDLWTGEIIEGHIHERPLEGEYKVCGPQSGTAKFIVQDKHGYNDELFVNWVTGRSSGMQTNDVGWNLDIITDRVPDPSSLSAPIRLASSCPANVDGTNAYDRCELRDLDITSSMKAESDGLDDQSFIVSIGTNGNLDLRSNNFLRDNHRCVPYGSQFTDAVCYEPRNSLYDQNTRPDGWDLVLFKYKNTLTGKTENGYKEAKFTSTFGSTKYRAEAENSESSMCTAFDFAKGRQACANSCLAGTPKDYGENINHEKVTFSPGTTMKIWTNIHAEKSVNCDDGSQIWKCESKDYYGQVTKSCSERKVVNARIGYGSIHIHAKIFCRAPYVWIEPNGVSKGRCIVANPS